MPSDLNELGLKPCPFCGGNKVMARPTVYTGHMPPEVKCSRDYPWTIECFTCQSFVGPLTESEADAITMWNKRPLEDQSCRT